MNPKDELYDDDAPIGRLLSRREALALFSGAGMAVVAGIGLTGIGFAQTTATPTITATGTPMPSCVVKPALTEGPYFVDVMLNRSDIRSDSVKDITQDGLLLNLAFQVMDVTEGTCKPLPGAQVDIWHCNATGVYSGVDDTSDENWLRGYQITDEYGMVKFITIYPGWYPGRAVHIHFKIRTDPEADAGYEFTSQFFFDDELSDEVFKLEPYSDGRGERNTHNENDGIYQGSEGLLTLALTPLTAEEEEAAGEPGYNTLFDIGLDLNDDTSAQSQMGGGQGGPGGNRPPGGSGTPPGRPGGTGTPNG